MLMSILSGQNGRDLPRACMMRPRKKKNIDHKVDTQCRIGRSFNDFKQFCSSNPDCPVVEMDSVAGRIGGKVLLTLQFNFAVLCWLFFAMQTTPSQL